MKTVIYKDDDITLEVEPNDEGILFSHCSVNNWDRGVYNRLKTIWPMITKKLDVPFVLMTSDSKKTQKFVKLFGFQFAGNIKNNDIFIYKVR